jgi:DNA polymerase phi
MALTRP